MNCRRHGSKPTLALWMLVGIADLALLAAAWGTLVMLLIVAGLVLLAGGVVATHPLVRQTAEPNRAVVRPRA